MRRRERRTGADIYGLLQSALARPQATAFGLDAYDSLEEKAGALLHSLARNHALVDGDKRLALAAIIAFLGLGGYRLTLTNDEAYTLVIEVASGLLMTSRTSLIASGEVSRPEPSDDVAPRQRVPHVAA